jgi:hypothetical protein
MSSLFSPSFRDRVFVTARASLEADARDMTIDRVGWRRRSNITEACGKVCGVVGTVLAYCASSELAAGDVQRILAFSAGCLGTISMGLSIFAFWALQESAERTAGLNQILAKINGSGGVDELPIITGRALQESTSGKADEGASGLPVITDSHTVSTAA